MAIETSTPAVSADIHQQINEVHGQVESLERELAQALDVWKSTLGEEKQRFEELLSRKDLAAREQDAQWDNQTRIYDERIAQMKAEFEARLVQAEQNAARALTEIDDAWQRDKLTWGPQAQSQWPAQRAELEAKVQELESKIALLEADRVAQASRPSPETVIALEGQLQEFQETVSQLQSRASQSDELVNACVQALDYQISVLYDLIHHHAAPTLAQAPEATDLASPQ